MVEQGVVMHEAIPSSRAWLRLKLTTGASNTIGTHLASSIDLSLAAVWMESTIMPLHVLRLHVLPLAGLTRSKSYFRQRPNSFFFVAN